MALAKNQAMFLVPEKPVTIIAPENGEKFTISEIIKIFNIPNLDDIIYTNAKVQNAEDSQDDERWLVWDDMSRLNRNWDAQDILTNTLGDCLFGVRGNALFCDIELLPDVLVSEEDVANET